MGIEAPSREPAAASGVNRSPDLGCDDVVPVDGGLHRHRFLSIAQCVQDRDLRSPQEVSHDLR